MVLTAVSLNGEEVVVPFENASRYTLTEESLEDTHGYVLKVPLDDAVVTQQVRKSIQQRVLILRWPFTRLSCSSPKKRL